MKVKKPKRSAEGNDRRAAAIVEDWAEGRLGDDDALAALGSLVREGPRAPRLDAMYVICYVTVRSFDAGIIRFVLESYRMHGRGPDISSMIAFVAEEFGCDALVADQLGPYAEAASDLGLSPNATQAYRPALARIEAAGLSWKLDGRSLAILDEARLHLEAGLLDEAKSLVRRVLVDRPLWLPALRTAAEVAWNSGEIEEARAFWKSAVAAGEPLDRRAPEARAQLLLGHRAEAEEIAEALLAKGDLGLDFTDRIELLLALGWGARADAALGPILAESIAEGRATGLMRHYAACMALEAGDRKRAKELWKSVSDGAAGQLVEENLVDLGKRPEDSEGPSFFRLIDWLPAIAATAGDLNPDQDDASFESQLDVILGALRTKAPSIVPGLARIMIRYGEMEGMRLVVDRCALPWFPELDEEILAAARDPALTRARRRVVEDDWHFIADGEEDDPRAEHSAEDGGKRLDHGAHSWREALFESSLISWEPILRDGDDPVEMRKAIELLRSESYEEAARFLQRYRAKHPADESAIQNLRYALNKLGDHSEVDRLGAELKARFPGYFWTQFEIAQEFGRNKEYRRAFRILRGYLARTTIHGDVLRSLLAVGISLALDSQRIATALAWYSFWKGFEPEPERLSNYMMLEALATLGSLARKMEKAEKRRAARKAASTGTPGDADSGKKRNATPAKTKRNPRRDDSAASGQQELF